MEPSEINWRGEISMQQVLADIRENPQNTFWLAFVRATGKDAGSIKIVSTALYGASRDKFVGTRKETVAAIAVLGVTFAFERTVDRPKGDHSDHGTLPMTDHTTGIYLTPLISHIIGYNLLKVKH